MQSDKIKHFCACAAVAFLATVAQRTLGAAALEAAAAGVMAGMAIGVGKEYGDRCAPGNRWDWADIGADALGTAAGAAAGLLTGLIIP